MSNDKKANLIFTQTIQVAENMVKGYLSTTIIVNLLLSASLSMLWGSINALQIITYFVFFNLYFPANV